MQNSYKKFAEDHVYVVRIDRRNALVNHDQHMEIQTHPK